MAENAPQEPVPHTGARRYRATRGVEQAADGWLRKRVDCDVTLEVAKSKALKVALEGTTFAAPDARPGDRPETLLVEDFGRLTSIAEIAEDAQSPAELMFATRQAAMILALLHARLATTIEPTARAAAAQPRRPFRGNTYLHCDYSPMNVFRDSTGRYVTLDGSPTFTATVSPITRGHPATDLATFTVALCWPLRPLHWRGRQLRMRLAGRRSFLREYESNADRRLRYMPLFECALFLQSLWFRKILRRRRS